MSALNPIRLPKIRKPSPSTGDEPSKKAIKGAGPIKPSPATKAIKGAGPIKKRTRRTDAQIRQIKKQIREEIAKRKLRQSIRHLFYLMTNPRLPEPIPKTEKGYKAIGRYITQMRREGEIPYSVISDMSRVGYHVPTYDGADDFLRNMAGLYRGDLWQYASAYVEIWCESRSIASVLLDDCREYAVSLYPSGGFTSLTFGYLSAMQINRYVARRQVPVKILYVGDFDPAGVLIDVKIEKELRQHLDPNIDMEFKRVGITLEQIEQYDLPTKPRKAKEKRAPHILSTVEAEALPVTILRDLVTREVEQYLPAHAIEQVKIIEEQERRLLLKLADQVDEARGEGDF